MAAAYWVIVRLALLLLLWLPALAPGAIVPARFAPGDALLIVAPHPDDEALCCAGAIQRARAAGARVAIVWLTSGDAFELDAMVVGRTPHPGKRGLERLAIRRMAEAKVAAGRLGVQKEDIFFLGYPDRGLSRLLTDYYHRSYRSRYTGADSVPYGDALAPGAAYQGQNLERDLLAVIGAVQPTLVLAPTPLDAHPDHRAAGELASRVLSARGEPDRAAWWIVHVSHHEPFRHRWPTPRGLHPELPLDPPPRAALAWQVWPMDAAEERSKEQAIRAHHTQMEVMAPFLLAFVRRNELYAREPLPEEPELPAP